MQMLCTGRAAPPHQDEPLPIPSRPQKVRQPQKDKRASKGHQPQEVEHYRQAEPGRFNVLHLSEKTERKGERSAYHEQNDNVVQLPYMQLNFRLTIGSTTQALYRPRFWRR
jgi:hypothetical protein